MSESVDPAHPAPGERADELAASLEHDDGGQEGARDAISEGRMEIDRRDFLGAVLGTAGGAVLGGLFGWGIAHQSDGGTVEVVREPSTGNASDLVVFYPRVRVAGVDELTTGVPVPFEYPLQGQTAELVKLGKPAKFGLGADGDIVAFSTKCTHMGWPLGGSYKADTCVWGPCPGHLSTFDAAAGGQCVLGQGTQNLPQVALVIDGNDIYAEGVLGLIYGYRDNLSDGTTVEATA